MDLGGSATGLAKNCQLISDLLRSHLGMDCLKAAPVPDPDQQQSLTKAFDLDSGPNLQQQNTLGSLKKVDRVAKTALITALSFGLLSLALLGLIIWLAVDNHHNKQAIAALQRQMSQVSPSSAKSTAAASLAGQGKPKIPCCTAVASDCSGICSCAG